MILTPIPLDNPWKRCAIAFFIFNTLSILMTWIAFDIKNSSKDFLENFFLVPMVAVFLFFIGSAFSVTNRAKYFVLIIGVFGMIPILIFSMLPFFLYIYISNFSFNVNFLSFMLYASFCFVWIFHSLKKTSKIEKNYNYLDSQIFERDKKKIIDRSGVLDFSILERKRLKSQGFAKVIIMSVAFSGYPLQKVILALGGNSAVFGFLSILSIPLSIYFMGKMASGYYLWIYSISKYEKKHNSKVMLINNVF